MELHGEVNSYTIVGPLGAGGATDVYRAEYRSHERRIDVAIKLVDRTPDQSEEALADAVFQLQELDHLCLPRVIDGWTQVDRCVIVMEYVGGASLRNLIDAPGPVENAQRPLLKTIVGPLLNVVEYLHAASPPYLHRDIKPANIILPAMHKRIVLVDLSLPQPDSPDAPVDVAALAAGYAAPEQYSGYAEPRSDYYALGATLYFILTGQAPPTATQRRGDDIHTLLRAARPDVSSAMQTIVLRLMALPIERRYSDVESIRRDLEQTPEFNQPAPIWPASSADAAAAPVRSTVRLEPAGAADSRPARAPDVAVAAAAASATAPGRGRRSLWLWGGLLVLLLALGSAAVYRALLDSGQSSTIVSDGGAAASAPAPASADPIAAASAAPSPTPAPTATPAVSPTPAPSASPTPAPTATLEPTPALVQIEGRIAFFGEQGISVLSNGVSASNLSAQLDDASPRWSPDGARIAFVSLRQGNRDIFVMDADGANLEQLTTDAADDTYPTWSPDGEQIAFVSERGSAPNVYVLNLDEMDVRPLTDNTNTTVRYEDLAWAPNGQLAVALQRNNVWNIHLIDERGDDQPVTTNPNPFTVQIKAPAWNPASDRIAFMSNVGGAWNVYVTDLGGATRPITRNTDQSIFISQPTWSPDGRQIGFIARAIVSQGEQQAYSYSINVVDAEADGAEPRPALIDDARLDDPDWIR
jgi:tRNA A-37 threonylcarbamoyl transferase component Bud32